MNKLFLLTTIPFLMSNNLLAKQKTIFDEDFLEFQISTSSKEQQILKNNGILLIDNKSKLNNFMVNSIVEMKPINSFAKFGFDFTYENTNYDSKTINGSSENSLSSYDFNIYTKLAIFKRKNLDLYAKTGFGYGSYTFENIDNRINGYKSGYQNLSLIVGFGSDIKLNIIKVSPLLEYNFSPFGDSMTITNNIDTFNRTINNISGIKFSLPFYFNIGKKEQIGIQYIYEDNTINLNTVTPSNDKDVILSYEVIYTKSNYIGFIYKLLF